MYRILKLVLLAVAANCAPATIIPFSAPLAQPYFLISPQFQPQYRYQPLLQIPQPSAPAAMSKMDSSKDQYVLLYPSSPQLPLILRQDGSINNPNYWQQINNWWNEFSSGLNPEPTEPGDSSASGSGSTDSKIEKLMLDKSAQTMQPLMPASTMPLNMNMNMNMNMNKERFFIISGQPQFYGNFAALQPATISNPILAIQPRSSVDSIPAEMEKVEQLRSQNVVELPQEQPVVQPVVLRSNFAEPLQRLEVNQPQIPLVNNEPVPELAAQQLARFLDEARSQDAGLSTGNMLNEKDDNKLRAEQKATEEETSIAQAKPSGIALSGKGGVSSSGPSATAVVGEGGLALASPSAIALSGDFQEEEEKRMEPL